MQKGEDKHLCDFKEAINAYPKVNVLTPLLLQLPVNQLFVIPC